jgi:hypothetical protein
MKIALIAPTKHLNLTTIGKNNYHMVLAQRYLLDKEYKGFYDNLNKKNNEILLDNGACELKESINNDLLAEVAMDLSPNYLILPDVLNSFSQTKARTQRFIQRYNEDQIDILGISNIQPLATKYSSITDRYEAITHLMDTGLFNANKLIHILGLGDSGHIEVQKLRQLDCIEGVDTSAPIVHGYYGIQFDNRVGYKKIRHYINDYTVIEKDKLPTIMSNIKTLLENARR